MAYRIIVTKIEPNPNFAKELEEYERANKYNRGGYSLSFQDPNAPTTDIKKEALLMELSDKQFEAVKREILKVF